MKSYPVKTALTVFFIFILLAQGCSNSDSTKTKDVSQNNPQLIGTWRQTSIGKEQVSGITVKLIFDEHTLTMDAPGCLIIGNYTTANDVFTYTITVVQGERCADTQKVGASDSVHYHISGSKLFLRPVSAGKESQTEYQRIEEKQHS